MFRPSFEDWKINGVLNPGGIRLKNGRILLLVRIAEAPIRKKRGDFKCPIVVSKEEYEKVKKGLGKKRMILEEGNIVYLKDEECKLPDISHFRRVILDKSGFKVLEIENVPFFTGIPDKSEYGVEDARITKIGGRYYMTYVAVSNMGGISSALASSSNLKKWKRLGVIFQEQNKDVVLFSEKINGKYIAFNRPETTLLSKPGIWISYSKDLIHWGKEKGLLRPRRKSWESIRNGAGPAPLKIKKGWLLIYHGVSRRAGKQIYSAGAALLDLKNPERIIARTPIDKPLFKPVKSYEKSGFINNVVFPTVLINDLDKRNLLIYSGGGDSVISVRKISLKEVLRSLEKV